MYYNKNKQASKQSESLLKTNKKPAALPDYTTVIPTGGNLDKLPDGGSGSAESTWRLSQDWERAGQAASVGSSPAPMHKLSLLLPSSLWPLLPQKQVRME